MNERFELARRELLNTGDGLPFEKIAGLRPDVILATDSYELADAYDQCHVA
ncbi:MAG: hypothetical protein M3460_06915 [Actinomycetota bacterium]|nr:hypothetical protein [Actinomycetota bacterium]